MRTLTTASEIESVSAGMHISHKIVGAILGTIAATLTGGPVGAGLFLSTAVAAEAALRLTDMFNAHGYNYQPNETHGIIFHSEFMW